MTVLCCTRWADPTVKAEVETWKERVTNFTQKTFGHSAVFLNGDRHSCRFKECNMGTFCH